MYLQALSATIPPVSTELASAPISRPSATFSFWLTMPPITVITSRSSATLPTFSSWSYDVPWLNTMYSWPIVLPVTLSDSSRMPPAPPSVLQCSGQSTLSKLSLILTIEFHLISPAGLHLLLSGHVKKPKHMNNDKDTILGAIIINGLFITIWCLVKFLPLLFCNLWRKN